LASTHSKTCADAAFAAAATAPTNNSRNVLCLFIR
jgi:hypothetical protein